VEMMTDPSENKDKFSSGFRTVQESFYDLCGKLEKTKHALQLAEEREAELMKQLTSTENARTETLERYKDIKSKYVDIKGKLRAVMDMELAPTPALRGGGASSHGNQHRNGSVAESIPELASSTESLNAWIMTITDHVSSEDENFTDIKYYFESEKPTLNVTPPETETSPPPVEQPVKKSTKSSKTASKSTSKASSKSTSKAASKGASRSSSRMSEKCEKEKTPRTIEVTPEKPQSPEKPKTSVKSRKSSGQSACSDAASAPQAAAAPESRSESRASDMSSKSKASETASEKPKSETSRSSSSMSKTRKDSTCSMKSTTSSATSDKKESASRKSSVSSVKPDAVEPDEENRPSSVISTVSHAESVAAEEKDEQVADETPSSSPVVDKEAVTEETNETDQSDADPKRPDSVVAADEDQSIAE